MEPLFWQVYFPEERGHRGVGDRGRLPVFDPRDVQLIHAHRLRELPLCQAPTVPLDRHQNADLVRGALECLPRPSEASALTG